MKKSVLTALCLIAVTGARAEAQEIYYWPAPAGPVRPGQMAALPMGTPLALVTRTQVSTKDNKAGDRFYLEVAESLSYRGQVVIPAGAHAVAEIIRSERNGHFGKKGKLDVRLLYVETPSGPIRLSGRGAKEGKSGTAASIATIVFVSGWGFLIHGTSAMIAADSPITAYLAEDLRFTLDRAATEAVPVEADQRVLPARFDATVFSSAGPRR